MIGRYFFALVLVASWLISAPALAQLGGGGFSRGGVTQGKDPVTWTGDHTFDGTVDWGTAETFTDSDTTPDVSTGVLFNTNTTGVTITDFEGTPTDGQALIVRSAGAIVFDCTGAGLDCGTVDITTADGDVTTWIYDGTDWDLVSFMNVSSDMSTDLLLVTSSGVKIGTVGTAPDGSGLHVQTGDAGTVTAVFDADDFVVEGSAGTGISILSTNNDGSKLVLGAPDNNHAAIIRWLDASTLMRVGTGIVSGILRFDSGNELEAARFDGSQNFLIKPVNGTTLNIRSATTTLTMSSGSSQTASNLIPDGAVVLALSTRVTTLVTGPAGYDVGDGSDVDRWGNSILVADNTTSDNTDWTATTIQAFTAANNVVITTDGVDFTAGVIRIVVHYIDGTAPTS